jgi:hypothetical protein
MRDLVGTEERTEAYGVARVTALAMTHDIFHHSLGAGTSFERSNFQIKFRAL